MIIQRLLTPEGEFQVSTDTPAHAECVARANARDCRFERTMETMMLDRLRRIHHPYLRPALGRCARVRANIKAKYATTHP